MKDAVIRPCMAALLLLSGVLALCACADSGSVGNRTAADAPPDAAEALADTAEETKKAQEADAAEETEEAQEACAAADLSATECKAAAWDMEDLFTDQLASYTTKVSGTPDRITNVRLAAENCDGVILLCDEVFSFNDAVGEQTPEAGFKKAAAILDGEIIQAYGGGICQVSSTVFAAALYAGLEIPERWNHYYVCRYIDAGLDAAVAWDALDLQIANNMEYPVRLDVGYADGYLTASIWGTRTDDTYVEIETRKVYTSDGFLDVQTYRNRYNSDKSQAVIERIAYSSYANGAAD